MLFGGVRLKAGEIVEEAQCLRLESSGFVGDHRHEPVVVGLKPLVTFGRLGAAGPVERVIVEEPQCTAAPFVLCSFKMKIKFFGNSCSLDGCVLSDCARCGRGGSGISREILPG